MLDKLVQEALSLNHKRKEQQEEPATVMTFEQRTARAIQKAAEQRAHVLSIPGRPGYYQVRSATDASERYIVSTHGGQVACSCRAAAAHNPCWHQAKVENRLLREAARRHVTAPSAADLLWN